MKMSRVALSLAALAVLTALLLAACGGGEEGLSRAEVEEIVRSEMADAPAPAPGLTSADVEEEIRRALAEMPQPEAGITAAEAESIARSVVVSIPARSAPAEYTRFFVEKAISRYETQGLEATLTYYNRPESTDGQWYVFIADEHKTIVAHAADPDLVGKHASQALGPNSYPAGSALAASATESGAWFDYTYANPASAAVETKHSWVIIHDGLIFGSGWYESGPSKSDAPSYTKAFVQQATNLYDAVGLEETLAYHNREESVDGQWYVFVIDQNDLVIGHPDPKRLGLDVKGWVGTDANGYNFGPEMLSATEDGKWVSYVYRNPESGGLGIDFDHLELKNVWVVRHDGLLFASGWYINADEFTKYLVATAARVFREVGLEGTIAYFASPEIAFAGLHAVIAYYNSAENVEGDWFAFIAGESGTIIDHYDKGMVGTDLKDLLGIDTFEATAEGNWVTTEDVRVWVLGQDGMTFGSGWHSGPDESN